LDVGHPAPIPSALRADARAQVPRLHQNGTGAPPVASNATGRSRGTCGRAAVRSTAGLGAARAHR